MARQCKCGGTIRTHQLTGNREAWSCSQCGRYESFVLPAADKEDAEDLTAYKEENHESKS